MQEEIDDTTGDSPDRRTWLASGVDETVVRATEPGRPSRSDPTRPEEPVLYPLVEPPIDSRHDGSAEAQSGTAGSEAAEPPAPSYSRFRIGHIVYWLDAVSYVGRKPSAPRIRTERAVRLVPVPSPRHEVSATHLELRQAGSAVVITDLRSTNGSLVCPPGSASFVLRQGESVVVAPGTMVDIGDGNVLEILLMSRLGSDGPPDDRQEGEL